MDFLQFIVIGAVMALVLWTILVISDNSAAGGYIFDRDRWPIVVGAWVLIVVMWLGSSAYGIWAERNMYRNQIQATIETVEPHRADIKASTGIDPLAEFISTESGDTSDSSDN